MLPFHVPGVCHGFHWHNGRRNLLVYQEISRAKSNRILDVALRVHENSTDHILGLDCMKGLEPGRPCFVQVQTKWMRTQRIYWVLVRGRELTVLRPMGPKFYLRRPLRKRFRYADKPRYSPLGVHGRLRPYG